MAMNYSSPQQFEQVSVTCKANIYFDGKVVSHTVLCGDGERKTLGLIFPGRYKFETAAAERMEIIAGDCLVQIAGQGDWIAFGENNWIHLQDGTGSAGTNDLAITTGSVAALGDTVLVKGILDLNQDFGHGYKYDLIIQDAQIIVE
jgi:uncharacterized protein YaiE (UPF0345 family)